MMSNKLLEIKNLHAGVAGREDKGEILQGLDLAEFKSPFRSCHF